MELTIFLAEYSVHLVSGLILMTVGAFCFDSYKIKKNQSDYSEEFRIFCLFLQTNPEKYSRTAMLELLDKAKIYSFKYGHLPRSKRPQFENILKEYERY